MRNNKNQKKSTKPKDKNFAIAIKSAQEKLFEKCKPNESTKSSITESLKYVSNWDGQFIKIDVSEDNIVEKLDDKEYTFSKKKFLSNKYFQNLVSDFYKSEIGNVYLRFFQSRKDENSYIIHVKA